MKFKVLSSLFAFVALAVLSLSLTSAATIFLDNFNSGIPSSWTPGTWSLTSGYLESGSSTNDTNSIGTRIASTSAFENIILSFDRQLSGGFEANEGFIVSVSYDGSVFNAVSTQTGNSIPSDPSFVNQNINIPSAANNNPNFKIRFQCITNAATEFCRIDNVKLDGTSIQSSNLTISGPSNPISIGQNATLVLTNSGSSSLQVSMSETSNPLFGVTFNPSSFSLSAGAQRNVDAILSTLSNLKFGLNTISVKADAGTQVATTTFQVKKTFCSAGEVVGNLSIVDINWENNGEGDDNSWELLDEIEIEVEVENRNDDDDVDAIVELGLFDSNGKNVADDLIFLADSDSDNEEIEININDDDEETVKWVFRVPADLKKGNYNLAIKVYDDDRGESRDCRDSSTDLSGNFFQSINVEEASDEGRYVIVDDISLDSQVTCGESVAGQFTVFNIGKEDQDRVRILIRNNDLGIDLTREITSDLDRGDDETMDFTFQVPPTARNGNYILEFITQYDYRNGVYREESEDSFDASFEVLGCSENLGGSGGGLTNLEIDARLESVAKPGKELVIVATIRNTGSQDATYSLSARGYSSWADLTDISDATISVDAGESKEVTFKMLVNKDSSGKQSFDIQVAMGGKVQIQEVEVELSSSSNSLFGSSNYLIWVIGAINLILIILIIVVAVRVSRR